RLRAPSSSARRAWRSTQRSNAAEGESSAASRAACVPASSASAATAANERRLKRRTLGIMALMIAGAMQVGIPTPDIGYAVRLLPPRGTGPPPRGSRGAHDACARSASREARTMTDALTQFKSMQKEAWAHFAPLEVWTTGAAVHLLRHAQVGPGHRLLDVACGTGVVAVTAARRGARATGLDLTPALLERAREHARIAGVEVDFHEGDVEALPF